MGAGNMMFALAMEFVRRQPSNASANGIRAMRSYVSFGWAEYSRLGYLARICAAVDRADPNGVCE